MMLRSRKLWLTVVIVLIIGIAGCNIWYWNTESGQRQIKSIKSSNVGLDRHIKVYSQSGELIAEYEGKIDIEDTEYGNKVLFDLNGKRIVLYNATVIVEEK